MADVNLANLANLLYELRGPMQRNFRKRHVTKAEIERIDSRELYTGSKVAVPIILNSLQGGGNPGESGTINVPQGLNTARPTVTAQNIVQPFSITLDGEEASMDNSAVEAMALLVQEARNSLAEIINDEYNASTALLATITGGSSAGLTVNVSATATSFDRLYPGRVVDVLTRSNGADPGQGKRRLISSFNESSGTVTFDTAQTASDGGSGNITFSANEGIYIAGTYGNSLSSLHDMAATSGTFQGVNKATTAGWQGVDGRGGATTSVALSAEILDGGVRRGQRNDGYAWPFALGDPGVIDLYKQSLYAQVRYEPQTMQLMTGFSGIVYDGADRPMPLIKEHRFEAGQLMFIPAEDLRVYGKGDGPDFVADDGSIARRFSRSLPKEIWLRDKQQLVAYRCNRFVRFANLLRAS